MQAPTQRKKTKRTKRTGRVQATNMAWASTSYTCHTQRRPPACARPLVEALLLVWPPSVGAAGACASARTQREVAAAAGWQGQGSAAGGVGWQGRGAQLGGWGGRAGGGGGAATAASATRSKAVGQKAAMACIAASRLIMPLQLRAATSDGVGCASTSSQSGRSSRGKGGQKAAGRLPEPQREDVWSAAAGLNAVPCDSSLLGLASQLHHGLAPASASARLWLLWLQAAPPLASSKCYERQVVRADPAACCGSSSGLPCCC